jgi:hypothetical protein
VLCCWVSSPVSLHCVVLTAGLTGLVLVIGGLATGMAPLVLVGGGLFVAGMVTTIVYGKKAADLASDVADTQNQINTITNSINDCKSSGHPSLSRSFNTQRSELTHYSWKQ